MNILLCGASGFIGRNLAAALSRAGHRVVAASRANGLDFCRLQQAGDWLQHLASIDVVINAVGIIGEQGGQTFDSLHTRAPIALFAACQQAGVRRAIQISALGTDHTAFSAYHLSKRAADDYLRSLALDWFVLRPSLIYGRGGGSAAFFLRLARLPLIPVPGDGGQALQPVFIGDVVAAVLACLDEPAARLNVDIVGDEVVAFGEWLQRNRLAQGLPRAALLPVPYRLAMACARLGRLFNPLLQPDNLRMLRQGYYASPAGVTALLGRGPTPFAPHLLFSDSIGSLS